MTSPPVLHLGVIGPGPDWESRYAPALEKLGRRVRIVSVYDATPSRARSVAVAHAARAAYGLRAALDPDVGAYMVLDSGWQFPWLFSTLAAVERPLFIGREGCSPAAGPHTLQVATTGSPLVFPEPRMRYQPALLRLRELMASGLDHPRQVDLDLDLIRSALDSRITLADVLGWCRTTFGLTAGSVVVESLDNPAGPPVVSLTAKTKSRRDIQILLNCHPRGSAPVERLADAPASALPLEQTPSEALSPQATPSQATPPPFGTVICEAGQVELLGPRLLRWNTGDGWTCEPLGADRSATDVAVDLFARRAIGGLIPVPDLNDLRQAVALAELATAG